MVDDDPNSEKDDSSAARLARACSRCDSVMELQLAFDQIGDRAAYNIFHCNACGAIDWTET